MQDKSELMKEVINDKVLLSPAERKKLKNRKERRNFKRLLRTDISKAMAYMDEV